MAPKPRLTALLLAACALIHPSAASARAPDQIIPFKETVNSSGDPVTLNLHVYTPEGHEATDNRPGIVFFFGGGWVSGSPEQFHPQCAYLASRGMVAISAEYRIRNTHGTTPQECVKDGKSAIRYVRENAASLGIDPDRIAGGGGSAGGHVAAAAGTLTAYEEPGEDLSISSRPDALVLFNPVYDNGPGGYGHTTVQAYWQDISPLHHISATTPPAVVFFGTDDPLVPVATARNFKSLMEAEGVRSDLHLYQDQPHGFFNDDAESGRYGYRATVFAMDEFLVSLGYLDDPHDAPAPVSGWTTIFGDSGFSTGSETTASPVTTDATADAIAAAIPQVNLADGDFVRITGSVTIDAPLTGGNFRIGLFQNDDPVTQGNGSGYVGIWAEAPATADTKIAAGDGTGANHPFETASGTVLGPIPAADATVPASTPVWFSLMISRNGDRLDLTTRFSDGGGYQVEQNLLNQDVANFDFNRVALLMTGNLNATQAAFSDIGITGGRVLADFAEPPAAGPTGMIHYIDAIHGAAGNTYPTGGSPGDTSWLDSTSNGSDANPTQWVLRSFGTDATIYQARHSIPPNDLPELTTEISGLADGNYDVWVFFWDGPNANTWTISAGLQSGDLATYSFDGPGDTASPVAASTLSFAEPPPMLTEDPRVLYGVRIGQAAVEDGNPIPVYIHNLAGGGSNTRTWYDGVGYARTDSSAVTGWIDRLDGSGGMVLGDAGSNAPTMGDGSPDNAKAQSIYAEIPEVALEEEGDNISLTGSATLVGIASSFNQFRIGLFDSNGSGDDTGWLGYSQGAGSGDTGGSLWERNAGNTIWYFSTGSGAATVLNTSEAPGPPLTDGTYFFQLTIERVSAGLQIDTTIIRLSDSQVFASTGTLDPTISTATFNRVAFLSGNNMDADQIRFSDIGITVNGDPPEPPLPPSPPSPLARLGPPLIGIDFNRTDVFGSPSQSFFRAVGGSSVQEENAASYSKPFGPRQVTITQPDGVKFEFRGGNGDASRAIPGGETSLSFLVADFIATRMGAIDLEIAGLAAGDYMFRSWHLDTLTTGTLGFAQGAATTTPNTIEARIGGDLMGSVQGTSLGSPGLDTTFISDSQIPRIEFEFGHDGSSPLILELRASEPNGPDNFLLLNGFAIYPKNP